MVKRILIDGLCPDSVQVAVVKDDVLTEIEYASTSKKQIKGNIYLATITRIEPALQAAFLDYGGERNGFISFSEVHPNYYNVPALDRRDTLPNNTENGKPSYASSFEEEKKLDADVDSIDKDTFEAQGQNSKIVAEDVENKSPNYYQEDFRLDDSESVSENVLDLSKGEVDSTKCDSEFISDEDEARETSIRAEEKTSKQYGIQEVLRRGQVLLVQAVKEMRGNKGATFTTHISLAGKYGVLMPNCNSPGGISRKITDVSARKELKQLLKDVVGPKGATPIGFIIRTSGQGRNKDEIQADYNYLVQLWNNIRTKTLASEAPAFIHSDDSLMKKVVVDLCDSETVEVVVQGESVYKELIRVIGFMALEGCIKVVQFNELVPIFSKFHVDTQIAALYSPVVYLNSGAYIVINHTEALTAIDINSGKSTSEKNIEETALKTNIEAAREIAKQLRLRDISGLIVIDFIDMIESKNRKVVERIFREALYSDKARVQLNRISMFGLLEMSRQRLRPSFLEIYASQCKHCLGMGVVKSDEINAISMLKMVEFEIAKTKNVQVFTVYLSPEIVEFVLNHKREEIKALELKYKVSIMFLAEAGMKSGAFAVEAHGNDENANAGGADKQVTRKSDRSRNTLHNGNVGSKQDRHRRLKSRASRSRSSNSLVAKDRHREEQKVELVQETKTTQES
jgi:ribonuclease E